VTTAPAPIRALRPIVSPQRMVALAPMLAPCLTNVGTICQSVSCFRDPSGVDRHWIQIISEACVWADEDTLLEGYTFWNESEGLDFDIASDHNAGSDLDEGADLGTRPNDASVEVDQVRPVDSRARINSYISCDHASKSNSFVSAALRPSDILQSSVTAQFGLLGANCDSEQEVARPPDLACWT